MKQIRINFIDWSECGPSFQFNSNLFFFFANKPLETCSQFVLSNSTANLLLLCIVVFLLCVYYYHSAVMVAIAVVLTINHRLFWLCVLLKRINSFSFHCQQIFNWNLKVHLLSLVTCSSQFAAIGDGAHSIPLQQTIFKLSKCALEFLAIVL